MTTRPSGKLKRLLEAHRDLYTSLLHLCEELSPAEWDLRTGCPGWTVRDVVAHVVGLEAILSGDPEPEVELGGDLAHVRNDVGRYMERHVAARRELPIADLLLEAREVFSRRLGRVETTTDIESELEGPMGTRVPAYRLLPIRVFDLWAHEQDVRRATARPGHLRGAAVDITLDRVAKGLAAKLGRCDIHGTALIEATGEHERMIRIDLDAGALLDAAEPDVRISMPFEELVARACGRADAPGPELLLIEGDRELADAILARFSITP